MGLEEGLFLGEEAHVLAILREDWRNRGIKPGCATMIETLKVWMVCIGVDRISPESGPVTSGAPDPIQRSTQRGPPPSAWQRRAQSSRPLVGA